MTRKLFCKTAVILMLFAAHADSAIWLDQPLENWNQPSAQVPQAPASSSDYAVRCKSQARPPENLADQALIGSGWLPFGALQSYGPTSIITAMSDADPSCKPRNYQAFVFSEGKVAGTLSRSLMHFESEGSIRQIRLLHAKEIEVDFVRTPGSKISTVRFAIRQNPDGPVVVPLEIRHSKEETTASAISPPVQQNPEKLETTEPELPNDIAPATREAPSNFLLPISNPALLKGCGCYLKKAAGVRSDEPYIFVTSILIEKRAWVNIENSEISLGFVRSTMPKGKFKLHTGYKFQEEYASGNTHILVEYLVKKLPGEGQPFAEYDATLTVETGAQAETIQATGICGCRN